MKAIALILCLVAGVFGVSPASARPIHHRAIAAAAVPPSLFDFLFHGAQQAVHTAQQAVVHAGTVAGLIQVTARAHGVPVRLALAVARVEGMSCSKVGRVGERGPMQVRPQTARGMGLRPRTCGQWVDAGIRYLRLAVAMHGAGCGGATAYNMGVYTRGTYCSQYGRAVMSLLRNGTNERGRRFEARRHHHRRHIGRHLARLL